MVEYRTDEERVSAIINFFNDYKKFFVWGSVGLFLVVLIFVSASNYRANQDSAAALFIGDAEVSKNEVIWKDLDDKIEQQSLSLDELINKFKKL